ALFPNYSFYNSQLKIVPNVHQLATLEYKIIDESNSFRKLLASKRIAFVPSEKHKDDNTNKTNTYEAKIISRLVCELDNICRSNNLILVANEPSRDDKIKERKISIGIITPYRSQIALIKREIHALIPQ